MSDESKGAAVRQAKGAVRLARQGIDAMTRRVQEVHEAIASRPYDVLDAIPVVNVATAVIRPVQEGITKGVYAAVRGVSSGVLAAAEGALGAVEASATAPSTTSEGGAAGAPSADGDARGAKSAGAEPPSGVASSILNATVGDHLAREGSPLAVPLTLRRRGVALDIDSAEPWKSAGADVTGKLVVFVHGLAVDDSCWQMYSQAAWNEPAMSYGKRLERDHGYTAVYARYNTGAPVADNGRALAHQIERIVATYPVPLEQLVLVGHSMGGLVIRAACALPATESWTAKVTDVFFLGTPHLGAPLEKLGRVAEVVLEAHPVTRPFAKILHTRSEGVKDLRFGLGAAADGGTSGILPHARYHLVAGSMAESKSLVGRMFGDGMVRTESAGAPLGARENVVTLSGVNHGALMNDPKVYAVIEQALAPETADPKAAGGPTAAA